MNDFIHLIRYLYDSLRWRLLIWLSLIVASSLLEGFTLGLFLPIIAGTDSDSPLHAFLTSIFDTLGLRYTLPLALGAVTALYVGRTALVVFQEIYAARAIANLLVEIKTNVVDRLLKADYQYFTRRGIGYFNNAVTVEFTNLTNAFDFCARTLVSAVFTAAYLILALAINPVLAVGLIVFGIPAYILLRMAFRLVQRVSLMNTDNNSLLNSHLIQVLNGFKYFKATASTKGISGAIASAIGEQGRLLYKQRLLSSLVRNGIDLFTVLLIVALLLYYVEVIGVTFVEIVFALFVMRRAVVFLQAAQTAFQSCLEYSGSVRLFSNLGKELTEHEEKSTPPADSPDFDQPIRLDDVSFRYDDSQPVLDGLTLVIPPKRKVAFVGASGSGKSTLVTLLTGILRPTSGEISIGGIPYDRIDQRELREGIGYVTQETPIFNDTVRNNVTLWDRNGASEPEVKAAARAARASDFIESFPEGYGAPLGDNGMKISGGQRQRVAIARELYKNAKMLIFDEATSSLDTETERAIQEEMDRMRGRVTVILIAHRLSTVRNSDMIFVLQNGKVVEQGTYDSLYDTGGTFAAMVDHQTLSNNLTRS